MHLSVDYFVTGPTLCMAPVGFQLDFFYCPSKNGGCQEKEIIKVGCLFTFWILSLRGRSKIQPMSVALNLLFTEPINFAKNPFFLFEMVAADSSWNSVAVDSYFIYSVLEIDSVKF